MVQTRPLRLLRTVMYATLLASAVSAQSADVTYDDLVNAGKNTSSWLMYGRTYDMQRHVNLNQINTSNANRLQPVWVFPTGGDNRGLEATPLIHEGVMYLSADQSRVFAIDARTGQVKWRYDPKLVKDVERVYCCGSVNRGVALLGNLVYVGTMDARLVALDRISGAIVWEAKVADWEHGYSITGAPLAVKGLILTGIAGGEYGIRGFIKAYDAKTGELRWTTHTIPGPGEPGNDTWPGDTWKHGGAPTWTTGAYDAELNQVYWNTGNAGPWNCQVRKGDNKWSASTLALDVDTGKIQWGFQYTPWDCWDYDAVSTNVLADVKIGGKPVKALMHFDKNGFYYVLDRQSGKFIYAEPIVPGINWAKSIDPVTGRPNVNPDMIAQSGGPEIAPIIPSLEGAIDWQPLAFNPQLGMSFFMSNNWAMGYKFWAEDKFSPPTKGEWFLGADYQQYLLPDRPTGNFVGFDVSNRKVAWRVTSPAPFWAGAVSTAGGIVFTGDMRGYFMAIEAKTGKVLWTFQTGSGIIASPITYLLDGVQYVAVPSGGIGGDMGFYYNEPKAGNLWVFALDGGPKNRPEYHNLVTLPGSLPNVGEPGATLGGRVIPGYGFPEAPERDPIKK
ncbi:MAG: PQQ-dependent dehydrogenase, methanol/ethanol family [Betaproteobacteria bacterium]|nr:PQQ-dependent dehydrogenase, methanol/ethanol family [Betaproteobacteria bacterium]